MISTVIYCVYLLWLLVYDHYLFLPCVTVYLPWLYVCIIILLVSTMCIYRDYCVYHCKSIELVSIHMYLYDISVSTLCNVYLPWLLCVLLYYYLSLYLIFLFLPCVMSDIYKMFNWLYYKYIFVWYFCFYHV